MTATKWPASQPATSRNRCPLLGRRRRPPRTRNLVDQAVELAGVLAGHLEGGFGRQVAELLFDVLLRFRPDALGMGIVGTPHHGLEAHLVDALVAHPAH